MKNRISVIIPVASETKWISEALISICKQHFVELTVIIVDSDDCGLLLQDCPWNSEIQPVHIKTASPCGLSAALNIGLREAKTPLVARMDADDWSHPERLITQIRFMEEHPDVTVCGTAYTVYETDELISFPENDAALRARMLFSCPICHPSVIMRREQVLALTGGYDESLQVCEDYDLWLRLSRHPEVRFATLPQPLLRYRTHPERDRRAYILRQRDVANALRERYWAEVIWSGQPMPPYLVHPESLRFSDGLHSVKTLKTLYQANARSHPLQQKALLRELIHQISKIGKLSFRCTRLGRWLTPILMHAKVRLKSIVFVRFGAAIGSCSSRFANLCFALDQLIRTARSEGVRETYASLVHKIRKYVLQRRIAARAFPVSQVLQQLTEGQLLAPYDVLCTKSLVLAVDHASGGGAGQYLKSRIQQWVNEGHAVLVWRYFAAMDGYLIELHTDKSITLLKSHDFKETCRFFHTLAIQTVFYNELVGWPNLFATLDLLTSLPKSHLQIMVHDYFCLCPSYHLMNASGVYCALPDKASCAQCLRTHNDLPAHSLNDSTLWRKHWYRFLLHAERITVPSRSVKEHVCKVYPDLKRIQIVPHPSLSLLKPIVALPKTTLCIGVIGNITIGKGAEIVRELADTIASHNLNSQLVVIGTLHGGKKRRQITVTGFYDHHQLPSLICKHQINMCIVPSICPESYCFVLQEIMEMNLPVVVFPLGAQEQRISEYHLGKVAKSITSESLFKAVEELWKSKVQANANFRELPL